MIDFRKDLKNHLLTLAPTWVPTVNTFDDHLYDVEVDQLPFLVINVREKHRSGSGEIGHDMPDLYTWTVHFYYLDITSTFTEGDDRMDNVMGTIEKNLELDKRLGNFESVADGKREYVWDSRVTDVLFDSSGQEEYYSFVSELYLDVDTAKN